MSVRAINSLKRRGGTVALRDLADLASVDISTVSRALNDDPRVNPDRAKHIRKLAEQVGYRPRPLRSKSTRSIGVVLASSDPTRIDGDFLGRVAWAAQRVLAERRLHVNLECIERSSSANLPLVVAQNRVDGVLIGGHPPEELVAKIVALGMPVVAINDSIERLKVSCVRSNPEPAIRQAILHLAARGHVEFCMFLNKLEYPTAKARYHSFEAALREIGIEPKPSWLVTDLPAEVSGGREGVRRVLASKSVPTAILCENDWMALGAIQELQQQGLRVPRDVSVVGHDDLWICEQMEPRLTSIHRNESDLVTKAVDLLLEEIDHVGPCERQEVLVEGHMAWRDSVAAAPDRVKAKEKVLV